jgi:hypothetical protein
MNTIIAIENTNNDLLHQAFEKGYLEILIFMSIEIMLYDWLLIMVISKL